MVSESMQVAETSITVKVDGTQVPTLWSKVSLRLQPWFSSRKWGIRSRIPRAENGSEDELTTRQLLPFQGTVLPGDIISVGQYYRASDYRMIP
jgi:hypothetical protein